MEYYDRYSRFRANGQTKFLPNIKIDSGNSDLFITFDKSTMRMDTLSYKYYGDPNYGWLIMLANPKYGALEFEIPDGVTLRLPYPLNTAITRYEKSVEDSLKNN